MLNNIMRNIFRHHHCSPLPNLTIITSRSSLFIPPHPLYFRQSSNYTVRLKLFPLLRFPLVILSPNFFRIHCGNSVTVSTLLVIFSSFSIFQRVPFDPDGFLFASSWNLLTLLILSLTQQVTT